MTSDRRAGQLRRIGRVRALVIGSAVASALGVTGLVAATDHGSTGQADQESSSGTSSSTGADTSTSTGSSTTTTGSTSSGTSGSLVTSGDSGSASAATTAGS